MEDFKKMTTATEDDFYEENNIEKWPLTIKDAITCLRAMPYAEDSLTVLNTLELSDELVNKMRDWDLATLAKASIYFYLTTSRLWRQKRKGPDYIFYDWVDTAPLILNPKTSKEVLRILPLFYFCPRYVKINGIQAALYFLDSFYNLQVSKESVSDLLIFLEIDSPSREILLRKTLSDQSFDKIVEFLNIYKHSINHTITI